MKTTAQKVKDAYTALKSTFGYKNALQAPRILKVVVSSGVGREKDEKRREFIAGRLARITGQKPARRGAKKSIASFKTRTGDTVGYQVTLRGARMFGFLDKFFNVSLPRTKDFRGVKSSAVDQMGNFTIGIKEHTIFPETSDEELRDVFGLAITIVTTTHNKKEATAFFEYLGEPFRK